MTLLSNPTAKSITLPSTCIQNKTTSLLSLFCSKSPWCLTWIKAKILQLVSCFLYAFTVTRVVLSKCTSDHIIHLLQLPNGATSLTRNPDSLPLLPEPARTGPHHPPAFPRTLPLVQFIQPHWSPWVEPTKHTPISGLENILFLMFFHMCCILCQEWVCKSALLQLETSLSTSHNTVPMFLFGSPQPPLCFSFIHIP